MPQIECLEGRQLLSWGAVPHLIGLDRAAAAFPRITGRGQAIAILDTGIDESNPDIQANVVPGYDFVANSSSPWDHTGHGTVIAGVIGAGMFTYRGQTYRGIAPDTTIIDVRIEDSSNFLPASRVAAGLQWVLQHRAQYNIVAVNLSIGDGNFARKVARPGYSTQLAQLQAAGVFVAAASGNDGVTNPPGVNYPGADPHAFAIGSVNPSGGISSFSNRGPDLTLLAPGASVPSTLYDPSNGSESLVAATGTSFAAPFAAGAAALLKQINPKLTPKQIASILRSTGTPTFDPATGLTFRRLNIYNALKYETAAKAKAKAKAATAKLARPAPSPVFAPILSLAGSAHPVAISTPFNAGQPIQSDVWDEPASS